MCSSILTWVTLCAGDIVSDQGGGIRYKGGVTLPMGLHINLSYSSVILGWDAKATIKVFTGSPALNCSTTHKNVINIGHTQEQINFLTSNFL